MAVKKKAPAKQKTASPPRRIETHRIDTQAVRVVRTKLTADWIERSVEDRDYGIDMMLEAFEDDRPTGVLILFQVKGHAKRFGDDVSMSVPVKTLLYAQMFQTPFFLLNVSIEGDVAYFVWLQKYINTRLYTENRRWDKQGEVTIHFPKDNILDAAGLEKILDLVKHVAHRDAGFTFLAHQIWLERHVQEFMSGGGVASLEQALTHLREIEKLGDFLDCYEDNVDALDLDRLRKVLSKAKAYNELDFGDDDVIDDEMSNLSAIRLMFLSRHEVDAFVAENMDECLPY